MGIVAMTAEIIKGQILVEMTSTGMPAAYLSVPRR
jgi:hypothetical protein